MPGFLALSSGDVVRLRVALLDLVAVFRGFYCLKPDFSILSRSYLFAAINEIWYQQVQVCYDLSFL